MIIYVRAQRVGYFNGNPSKSSLSLQSYFHDVYAHIDSSKYISMISHKYDVQK